MIRGIRGATTVANNTKETILVETDRLLRELIRKNDLRPDVVSFVQFTMTSDLDAVYPAVALRSIEGWSFVPMMCLPELNIRDSLQMCIRVMFLVETDKLQKDICHIYLNEASTLRPDLVKKR